MCPAGIPKYLVQELWEEIKENPWGWLTLPFWMMVH